MPMARAAAAAALAVACGALSLEHLDSDGPRQPGRAERHGTLRERGSTSAASRPGAELSTEVGQEVNLRRVVDSMRLLDQYEAEEEEAEGRLEESKERRGRRGRASGAGAAAGAAPQGQAQAPEEGPQVRDRACRGRCGVGGSAGGGGRDQAPAAAQRPAEAPAREATAGRPEGAPPREGRGGAPAAGGAGPRPEHAQLAREQPSSPRRAEDKVKERAYLHRRGAMEASTARRLWRDADARRLNASNGTLPEAEMLLMLDVTKEVLESMIHTIVDLNDTGAWFDDRLEGVRRRSVDASAKMLEAVKTKAATFNSTHRDYDGGQFVARLARLFNDTKADFRTLMQASDTLLGRLDGSDKASPEKFTSALALALQRVMGNVEFRGRLDQIDTARLNQATAEEGCSLLGGMLTSNLQPAYRSLERMGSALDGMSKIVNVVQDMPEYVQPMLTRRINNVLNMAYAEHQALKEASAVFLEQVAPVVVDRLHCGFNSAAARADVGLAALAAAVAWLAQ